MKRQRFTNPTKGFVNRRNGIMKKSHALHQLTGAHIAVLFEYEGKIYSYRSDNRFSNILSNIHLVQQFGPDHFDTVADRTSPRKLLRGKAELDAPTLPITNSGSNHCSDYNSFPFPESTNASRYLDKDSPVVVLGSPFSPYPAAAAEAKSPSPLKKQPYPLAVDFFRDDLLAESTLFPIPHEYGPK